MYILARRLDGENLSSERTELSPILIASIVGGAGAALVLFCVSLFYILSKRENFGSWRTWRQRGNPKTLPTLVPDLVQLDDDHKSLANTTLGEYTAGRRPSKRRRLANLNDPVTPSFDEESLYTSVDKAWTIRQPNSRAEEPRGKDTSIDPPGLDNLFMATSVESSTEQEAHLGAVAPSSAMATKISQMLDEELGPEDSLFSVKYQEMNMNDHIRDGDGSTARSSDSLSSHTNKIANTAISLRSTPEMERTTPSQGRDAAAERHDDDNDPFLSTKPSELSNDDDHITESLSATEGNNPWLFDALGSPKRAHRSGGESVGSVGISIGSEEKSSCEPSAVSSRSLDHDMDSFNRETLVVPPGRLGVILANRHDGRGTVVSEVKPTSVLKGAVRPGDELVAIDHTDVTGLLVSEITSIMAQKSGQRRTLTIQKWDMERL